MNSDFYRNMTAQLYKVVILKISNKVHQAQLCMSYRLSIPDPAVMVYNWYHGFCKYCAKLLYLVAIVSAVWLLWQHKGKFVGV